MKSKNHILDVALHIATILVVVTSVVLWIFILTSDRRFSSLTKPNTATNTHVRLTKSLKDAYVPTEVLGYKNNKLYQLYDSDKNLPLVFSREFNSSEIQKVTPVFKNKRKYNQYMNNTRFLQLSYPDQITFGIFSNHIKKSYLNSEFNRIFVAKTKNKNRNIIYAGNDDTRQMYEIKLKKADFSSLIKYAKAAESAIQVKLIKVKEGYAISYSQAQKVKIFSYLITNQSDSYFVSRLLGTSGVTSKTIGDTTSYSSGLYDHLEVPKASSNNYHNYTYTNYYRNTKIPVANVRLSDSVSYVHKLGLVEQDLRFFDAFNNSVYYTNYIEGYPVFIKTHGPQIKIHYAGDNLTIKFNSTNLQIPIPFDGRTRTVPKTDDVFKVLQNKGIPRKDIEQMTVGFELVRDNDHDNLVDLEPTYYIKIYNHWMSLSEWQNANLAKYQHNKNNATLPLKGGNEVGPSKN
ncbi:hypothetical protein [Lactobacillus psittaci]|uniref:YycH protein n=1 Tax=Lactobacillus psittaci DSM 15354 TaxID=1122152 RepID=A0A0R1RY75_9LACO|nr:hypothetical protein [Lactobacillus psittaci]KRL61933.1 YycH protein [Lactobacillus psittaci DSM 15354]